MQLSSQGSMDHEQRSGISVLNAIYKKANKKFLLSAAAALIGTVGVVVTYFNFRSDQDALRQKQPHEVLRLFELKNAAIPNPDTARTSAEISKLESNVDIYYAYRSYELGLELISNEYGPFGVGTAGLTLLGSAGMYFTSDGRRKKLEKGRFIEHYIGISKE